MFCRSIMHAAGIANRLKNESIFLEFFSRVVWTMSLWLRRKNSDSNRSATLRVISFHENTTRGVALSEARKIGLKKETGNRIPIPTSPALAKLSSMPSSVLRSREKC